MSNPDLEFVTEVNFHGEIWCLESGVNTYFCSIHQLPAKRIPGHAFDDSETGKLNTIEEEDDRAKEGDLKDEDREK